jgi:hypothetical protein
MHKSRYTKSKPKLEILNESRLLSFRNKPYFYGGAEYKVFSIAKRNEEYPDENVLYEDPNWRDIMLEKVAIGIYCLENQPPEIKAAMKDDYDNTMEEYKGYLDSDTTEDLERTYSTMADLFRNEDYKIYDIRKEVVKEVKAKKGKKEPKDGAEPKEVDNRTPQEKRLALQENAAKEASRQRGRFVTIRNAIIRMKDEYMTGKTKNDLPVHYSIVEKLPEKIRERVLALKDVYKEFKDAYKLFKYHDDLVVKKKYGLRYDLKWNYSTTKKEMNSVYKKMMNKAFLYKAPPPVYEPQYEEKELEEKGEHPPDFGKDYVSKVVMHNDVKKKKKKVVEEVPEVVIDELEKCHEDNNSLIDKYNALVVKYTKLSDKNKKCKKDLKAKKPEKVSKQQVKEEVKAELPKKEVVVVPKKDVVERGYNPKGKTKQQIYDDYIMIAKEMESIYNKTIKVQRKMKGKFDFEPDYAKLRKQFDALNKLFDEKLQYYRDIEQYVLEKRLGEQYVWKDVKQKKKKKENIGDAFSPI